MPGELEMNSSNSHFSPDILSKGTFDGYATNAHFVPMLLIENMKRVRWHGSLPYSSLTISLMNQFFFVQLLGHPPDTASRPESLCLDPPVRSFPSLLSILPLLLIVPSLYRRNFNGTFRVQPMAAVSYARVLGNLGTLNSFDL
jgi:hypothetical protein